MSDARERGVAARAVPAGAWCGTRRWFAALVGVAGLSTALGGRDASVAPTARGNRAAHTERPLSDGTHFDDGRGWIE